MDPSALLVAEVAGMIFVALVATAALVKRDLVSGETRSPPTAPDPPKLDRTLPVTLFCPAVGDEALVSIGAVSTGPARAELRVAECEYLPLGTVTCEMACLGAAPRA